MIKLKLKDNSSVLPWTLQQVEALINDGRKITGKKHDSIMDLFDVYAQKEGVLFWMMANTLFDIEGEVTYRVRISYRSKPTLHGTISIWNQTYKNIALEVEQKFHPTAENMRISRKDRLIEIW